MVAIYPNIVPQNDLRLPDALTIKHGPAPLLARFVLEGDKAAREIGIRLRLRHDFRDERILRAEILRKHLKPDLQGSAIDAALDGSRRQQSMFQ